MSDAASIFASMLVHSTVYLCAHSNAESQVVGRIGCMTTGDMRNIDLIEMGFLCLRQSAKERGLFIIFLNICFSFGGKRVNDL